MSLGPAVLLGLVLSAPQAAPPPRPAGRAPPQPPITCSKYRVQAEKNDLAADADVAAWVTAGLERAAILDPRSPCYVHVRITAAPTRMSGKEDGWVAHVAVSTRRYQKDGRLLTREKGLLVVDALREVVVWKVRTFLEEFVDGLATAPPGRDVAPSAEAG